MVVDREGDTILHAGQAGQDVRRAARLPKHWPRTIIHSNNLAAQGATVVAAARDSNAADVVAAITARGGRAEATSLDVTDAQAARTAIAAARRHFGQLDVVVNNAGYANVSPIETTDDEDFRAQFETNFWGVYHVSKAAIPVLRDQRGGLVMQISSVGGRVGGSRRRFEPALRTAPRTERFRAATNTDRRRSRPSGAPNNGFHMVLVQI